MNTCRTGLIQQWYVETDEHGIEHLVARWVCEPSPYAAGILLAA